MESEPNNTEQSKNSSNDHCSNGQIIAESEAMHTSSASIESVISNDGISSNLNL